MYWISFVDILNMLKVMCCRHNHDNQRHHAQGSRYKIPKYIGLIVQIENLSLKTKQEPTGYVFFKTDQRDFSII